MKQWYSEHSSHTRIHDYFSLMVNQFPILVIRRVDNPYSVYNNMNAKLCIGILGFTFIKHY